MVALSRNSHDHVPDHHPETMGQEPPAWTYGDSLEKTDVVITFYDYERIIVYKEISVYNFAHANGHKS